MSQKVGAVGGNKGDAFDDGVFDGVKKITVGKEFDYCISYIKIEYEKDENLETRVHGTIRGDLNEFTLDYPNEYITAVGGTCQHIYNYQTVLIKSLFFKTNARTSPTFGTSSGTQFMLEGENGGQLVGFYGRSGQALDALGAHFAPIPVPMGIVGGTKGNIFNDGTFDGVKKVTVAADQYSITYIKIEYEKDGKVETREHGTNRGGLKEFTVNYPKDYIVAVGGTYDHIFTYDTTLITSLYFTTSKGFTSTKFGETKGTEFKFEGGKLVGFYGRDGRAIDAFGAHFAPLPIPMGPVGGTKGNIFDDGTFDGVKKVTVGADEFSLTYVKIEYEKKGKVETREHGTNRGQLKEFTVNYPKDNIVAIGGTHDHIFNYDTTLVTSLYFTTSKGFTSPLFGETKGTEFNFRSEKGGKLVGLFGRGGDAIDAIGVSFLET